MRIPSTRTAAMTSAGVRHPSTLTRVLRSAHVRAAARRADWGYSRTLRGVRRAPETALAVVVHVFYTEMWPALRARLSHLARERYDLFVSVVDEDASFATTIRRDFPHACIYAVPNRGRDVLPFLAAGSVIRRHGYVEMLKVHTKRSPHRADGLEWSWQLLDNLLPSDATRLADIRALLRRPETGMVGVRDHYVSLAVNLHANERHVLRGLERTCGAAEARRVMSMPREFGFFAGTMFWSRVDAIAPIFDAFRPADFEPEYGQVDGTLAHALERVVCVLPALAGRDFYGVSREGTRRLAYEEGSIPSWAQG